MKNFGKLHTGVIQFPQYDLEGNLVTTVEVIGFFDDAGVEWHALHDTDPYGAYIAVDDFGRIASAQTDFEQIQLAGLEIWGLDDFYGYTFGGAEGTGATCLGCYWDGDEILAISSNIDMVDLSYNQFHTMLEIIGKKDEFAFQIENLSPMVKKIMSRNIYNNPNTIFFFTTEVVALVAPLVWGANWKTILEPAWREAKEY